MMNGGLFNSRDDLSDLLHELRDEFDVFGNASFAIRKVGEYDEITYPIIAGKVESFNKWIKENSDRCAELSVKHAFRRNTRETRDIFTDANSTEDVTSGVWEVYLVWTGRRF